MKNHECDLLLNALALLKVMFMEKVFYIVLKFLRLTLGIGNLMSSHSLSASHMPLGTGRDNVLGQSFMIMC